MRALKVLIAGGGIGGLTAALCLAQCGCVVDVFEQAAAFGEVGAGIQLSPNCSRVLLHLGLGPALQAVGFLPQATQFRAWDTGEVLGENRLGAYVHERHGAPYFHVHRGDLLGVLVEAAARTPGITLHTGMRVRDCAQDGQGVALTLEGRVHQGPAHARVERVATDLGDGGGGAGTGHAPAVHTGDVLIGADGIHSVVRAHLWGDEQPRFTGNVAWRALVPAERLPSGLIRPMSTAWWGPHKHFVHYYVRGGALVNCVCVVEKAGWEIESWTERGALSELRADFAGWHADLQTLIDAIDTDALFKWALYDRTPMSRWGVERITLLGDACHPTLPFMAQGAAMAIEDAAVLAGCLARGAEVPAALQRYEDMRRDRTAGIQNGSRRNATRFHLSGAEAEARNHAMRTAGERSMDDLYGYDALTVGC